MKFKREFQIESILRFTTSPTLTASPRSRIGWKSFGRCWAPKSA